MKKIILLIMLLLLTTQVFSWGRFNVTIFKQKWLELTEYLRIDEGGELRFYDVGSSHYTGFEAPALTANQIYVLPAADGTSSQVLITDGSGALGWADAASSAEWTRTGTILSPATSGDDIDGTGGYLLDSQSITNLSAKGAGYWFDGVNDYVTFPADVTFTSNNSLEFIINVSDFSLLSHLVSKGLTEDYIRFIGDGSGLTVKGATETLTLTYAFSVDKWYEIIITNDGTNVKLYVNGNLEDTESVFTDNNLDFNTFGKLRYFDGMANKIGYFNTALTADEIKDLYSGAELPYKYIGASQTDLMSGEGALSVASANATAINGNYSNIQVTTTDVTAAIASNVLTWSMTANGSTRYIQFNTGLEIGKKYRFSPNITAIGGTWRLMPTPTYSAGDEYYEITSLPTEPFEFTATKATLYLVCFFNTATLTIDSSGGGFEVVQIGNVANYSSDGVGHNTWSDTSGNNLYGTVSGAKAINMEYQQDIVRANTITGDSQVLASSNVIPAGYMLKSVIVTETAGGDPVLDFGTTDGGNDIMDDHTFTQSSMETVNINNTFSLTEDKPVWITNDGGWDSGSINVIFVLERVQ